MARSPAKHSATASVDDYIAAAHADVRPRLEQIRRAIRSTCPSAVESIAYGMSAYKFQGQPLAYFAAFTHHVGVYALPAAHAALAVELSPYKRGKGSVQFPNERPLPVSLIKKLVARRLAEIELIVAAASPPSLRNSAQPRPRGRSR